MEYNFQNKKILVVGGGGFIGSRTVNALLQRGARVSIIDNLSTGERSNIHPQAKFYNLSVASDVVGDIIRDERPEIIYLFSYFVLVPKSVENPLLDFDCLAGFLKLLQVVKEIGVQKVIFASSGFLYGNTSNLPAKETEPISPISPYVISKSAFENYLRFYKSAFGIPYVILRYAAVYGPRQRTGAMADYIRKLSIGEQAQIWGDGTKTRDYVYIDDVIHANLLALNVTNDHSDPVFNVGTGQETTLNELYSKIAVFLDKKAEPVYLPDRPGEQMRYCLDYSKIREYLGWEPTVTLDEGLGKILTLHSGIL